ncbi:hypothetical protein ENKNEFLB_02117 [Nocardioides aquaticus]|uniref:Uncharacterized protein n=2 Tax=Nocardioides aquaticus TaxID=160826 RepID=A0ABX8EKU7_9ACTN|nr:hypothetical protein ENKNEFLB_02117 [Nocardioides aquaticus]
MVGASLAVVGPAAAAPGCEPYCDDRTTAVANQLDGRGHGAWLATTLEDGGYNGRRRAEITKIPDGHGKRYVGVIHVPAGKPGKVRRALSGSWYAQRRTVFVLPLRTRYDTRGAANAKHREAAQWAARRLGGSWVARRP